MEIVSFKLQEDILEKVDNLLKPLNFNNRTEFIRDAIRDKLSEIEKQEAIRKLAELKGSLKGKARMSEKRAGELAFKELAKEVKVKLD